MKKIIDFSGLYASRSLLCYYFYIIMVRKKFYYIKNINTMNIIDNDDSNIKVIIVLNVISVH